MANVRRTQARRGQQWNRWLTVVGYSGLGLGCLLLAAATFIILAAPVDQVRDQLVRDVKARTGRDLVVAGPTSLILFPRLAVSFTNVALSVPPGMRGEPTLRVQTLEAEVSFWSLLSPQAGIRRLVLSQPTIELRVDAQGRRSWDFAATEPQRVRVAQAPTGGDARALPTAQRGRRAGTELAAELEKVLPTSVHIINGTVRYIDERAGVRHDIKSLGLELAVNDVAGPLEAKGGFGWRGEQLTFEVVLSPVQAVLQEQRARLTAKLAGPPIEANYDGALDFAPGLALDGIIALKAPSVQAVANWLGSPLASGQDPGALSLSSSLKGSDSQLALSRLTANLGGTSLNGELTIETTGVRPFARGSLQLTELDLGQLLTRPGAPAATPSPSKRLADPIDDILRRSDAPADATRVRGTAKRADGGHDWSDDLVDLGPLGLADAEVALSLDRLVHRDVKTGPSRLSLKLKDKIAKLTLQEMELYGGRGRGVLTLDGSAQTPVAVANLTLEGVSTQPLLKDALGFDWLEGRGTITLALAGQGVSERQMVETLNGKLDMSTANGAVTGFDVGKFLRSIEQGRIPDLGIAAGEKTPFSELAGSYTITNGVARNQDLRLVSPNLRVTGSGTINLAARSLDYTVNPKIVASTGGDRAVINLAGLELPVRIEGPWDKPNFSLKGQERILEVVKELGKNIKSKDVEEALKGLFGGGEGQRSKPLDFLDKFLKKP